MNGLTGNKERHARSHFQIVIRLQMVRAQVHDRLHRGLTGEHKNIDIDGILMGIQGVAVAAREAGLAAFTSVCLRVCERIEPSLRIGYITRPTLALVAEWAANGLGMEPETVAAISRLLLSAKLMEGMMSRLEIGRAHV